MAPRLTDGVALGEAEATRLTDGVAWEETMKV